ncbi:RHS repeat-associated protein [Luteibacter rhizovicinus]|uniref:RHS repeat-associated protein n=1 Tax=Luteibacter rhizovicinus TaxID=242606 RepID=A0A4R3YVL3_9GAMM|nr:RHS repeat-associated core domain-containing protein [Luteibacter rhizovicinus]TCV95858.1 RHS repeat-associated protein [Luteibacter rhizovicinus]
MATPCTLSWLKAPDQQGVGTKKLKIVAGTVLTTFLASAACYAEEVTYYLTNPLGTPLVVTDAQNNIIRRLDQKPYGQGVLDVERGAGYTGHVVDEDTDLIYMQARYYDPELGRFLSTDPVASVPGTPATLNRFAYAFDNPLSNPDPDGRVVVPANDRAKRLLERAVASSTVVRGQYERLNGSTNTFRVENIYVSSKNGGQSHVVADQWQDALKKSYGGTGKGSGGTIYINRSSEAVLVAETKGGEPTKTPLSQEEVISHEFAHAIDNDTGNTSGSREEREHNAREIEDSYRDEKKLPGRRNNVDGN